MTIIQLQRILDCFSVGRVLNFVELDKQRMLIETAQGIFGIVGIKPGEVYSYEDPKLERKVNNLFGSRLGQLVKTDEFTLGKPKQIIPLTHKYNLYWYCLKF